MHEFSVLSSVEFICIVIKGAVWKMTDVVMFKLISVFYR